MELPEIDIQFAICSNGETTSLQNKEDLNDLSKKSQIEEDLNDLVEESAKLQLN